MTHFLETIRASVEREDMFSLSDKLLVTVSGGADSVCLLYVLCKIGFSVEAVHCNFHLRAEESNRDEAFVRNLCDDLGVKLFVEHFNTFSYASAHKVSIEMAAREQRYAYFEKLRKEREARFIAVAHHRDDNVETLLLNLIRGTGMRGLCAMQYVNGRVVRPLLDVSRDEIVAYLVSQNVGYITDSTNLIPDFTRNRIRLQLLPLMRGINPSVDDTIEQTIRHLCDVAKVYKEAIERSIDNVCTKYENEEAYLGIDIPKLQAETSPRSLLHEILHPYGFSAAVEKQIFEGLEMPSGAVYKTEGWVLLRDRNRLLLKKTSDTDESNCELKMPSIGEMKLSGGRLLIIEHKTIGEMGDIPRDRNTACLDASKVDAPLVLRHKKDGDRFFPFGMKGSKLLSDYFIDRKFSLFEKENQLIVESGGKIAWVVGERTDARFSIDRKTTQNVIMLTLID